jgi:hypothetical protein
VMDHLRPIGPDNQKMPDEGSPRSKPLAGRS